MESSMNYDYDIPTETPNKKVDSGALIEEIRESAITIAVDSVVAMDNDLTINFKASLSSEEQTMLDGLVGAHTGEPIDEPDTIQMKPLLAEGGKRKSDRGISFVATQGTTTTADYLITEDLQIKGGVLVTDNNEIMDTVGMEIVDTTYMHAGDWYPSEPFLAGIPVPEGTPWSAVAPTGVSLHAYIKDFPVMKSGETFINNEAITVTPLNGLTIRITYTSTGSVDVNCNIGILAYS
jgi:hypothetical protein